MAILKRVFATMLTLVLMLSLFPSGCLVPAYAYDVHTENDGIHMGGNTAYLVNKYTYNEGIIAGIQNHLISGAHAFCLDPTTSSEQWTQYYYAGTGLLTYSSYWNSMSAADKRLITGIAVYYANNPEAYYVTPGTGHQPDIIAKIGAQYAVFENVVTNPEMLDERLDSAWDDVKFYAANAIEWAYSQESPSVSTILPSFDGQAIELIYDPYTEMYEGSVTDTNGALSSEGYQFAQTINGVQVTQYGDTLTISATPAAAESAYLQDPYNNWAATATVTKYVYDPIDLGAARIYERPGEQPMMVYDPYSVSPTAVDTTASIRAYVRPIGTAAVQKSSSAPAISDNNSCYTLAGAVYGIYASEEDAQFGSNMITSLITDYNGSSDTVSLGEGTYYLKESSAPSGFALNTDIVPFSVEGGQTTIVQVADTPVNDPISVILRKIDAITGEARPAGGMSLANAEYTVCFYPGQYSTAAAAENSGAALRSWVMRTDEDGYADLRISSSIVSGDEFWRDSSGNITFPLGSVVIYESKAPTGFLLDPTHYIVNITEDGSSLPVVSSYNAPEVPEQPILGSVTVKKIDAENSDAHGDATLAGAKFGLINENSQSVTIGGVETAPGGVALVLETDAGGVASSGQVIPYGSYSVREIEAPAGHELNDTWSSGVFSITAEGQTIDAGMCADYIQRGSIAVQKLDAGTLSSRPQVGASLAGAEISIINSSNSPVVVNGESVPRDAVVAKIVTNENGYAETDAGLLPYGTYKLVETKAPSGYGVNPDWNPVVEIRESRQYLLDGNDALIDDVSRGDIFFIKIEGSNKERLQNVPFRITSNTTGESHIGVTDANGAFNTSTLDKTVNTNGNDAAVNSDGSIDESVLNSSWGIWFYGTNIGRPPANAMGAFPYGIYTFEELPVSANSGYELVSFQVEITYDGQLLDIGTVEDKLLPFFSTELVDKDTDDHIAAASANVALIDRVNCYALRKDRTYEIVGTLVDQATGDPIIVNGASVTASSGAFRPTKENGGITLQYTFDATAFAGKSVVSVASLMENGVEIFVDRDLSNANETVCFPSIGTSAHGVNGEKELTALSDTVVVDTISFVNLIPDTAYVINSELVDKKTGAPPVDKNGNAVHITAEQSFTPSEANGTVDVEIRFDATKLGGVSLVAFERLSRNSVVIARHEDVNDRAQTITIPMLETTLVGGSNEHVTRASDRITLTDTVVYGGLEEGVTYTLRGTLMDKATGEKAKDSDGNEITAVSTFEPDSTGAGSVNMTFTFNGIKLAGSSLVAFEELSTDYGVIARHAQIDDEAQTVHISGISTSFTDDTGHKDIYAEGTRTLIDTVSYEGLAPSGSKDYRLVATLMDKDTSTAIVTGDGHPITAETTFSVSASRGTVEVKFELGHCEYLAGHSVVAFESLYYRDELIAEHNDIEDAEQTILFPKIETTLTNGAGSHVSFVYDRDSNGKAISLRLTDVVAYKNLVCGEMYALQGVLMDKSTGQPFKDSKGNQISASTIITVKEGDGLAADGFAELVFELNPSLIDLNKLQNSTLVAFETLYRGVLGGAKIAEHADLNDESQSIHFPSIRTSARAETGASASGHTSETVTIIDTVSYHNLIPGLTYKLSGCLMNKEDQGVIRGTDNQPILAEKEFIPDQPDGTVEVVFTVNASTVYGKKAVVFEDLILDRSIVAEHRDIGDASQTVQFSATVRGFKYDATEHRGLPGAVFRIVDKGLTNSSESVMLLDAQEVTSGEDGYFTYNVLPGHQYSITEIKAPDGYLLASGEFIVNVDGKCAASGDVNIANVRGGTVVITKTDSITGVPMSDCEISVYKLAEEAGNKRELVFKQTTDSKGRIYFYTLDKGTYIFKETAAREGYYLNEEEYMFVIKRDQTVEGETRITNVPYGTVVIKKVSSEGSPLQGAQFAFFDANGRSLGQGVSDARGRVYFVSPGPGDYYFSEVKAPQGYELNTERCSFRIGTDYRISGTVTLVNNRGPAYSKTGDSQNLNLWLCIAIVSFLAAAGGTGVVLYSRKRRSRADGK